MNNNQNWFVASLESTVADDGCLMQWMTPASSSYWWSGVWGTNTNEFNIWLNYKGLSIKPTGGFVSSGNLDVGPSQAVTSIKAYVNHAGHQGNVEIKALWSSQGYVNFNTTYPGGV